MQVDALVILWARVVDRINMGSLLAGLSHTQLSSLLSRLGYSHVLRAVGPPFGCRLSFAIAGDPDQEAAARHVCRMAGEAQKVHSLPMRMSWPHHTSAAVLIA